MSITELEMVMKVSENKMEVKRKQRKNTNRAPKRKDPENLLHK